MMILDEIVSAQKRGEARGIASICSAHPVVLETAMRVTLQALVQTSEVSETSEALLVEATCNQVNQFGGYTGMQPRDFARFVGELADRVGLPREQLLLGGDHLGPNPWQHEPAAKAMEKAKVLVRDFVQAGFTKIHLDASMKLADDPPGPLPVEVAAERAAELAKAAEEALAEGKETNLRYVIGTEVPVAGGAQEQEALQVTAVADLAESLEISRAAFHTRGLDSAWERASAVVVQPGVEFGDASIHAYDRAAAADLARFIERQPLVFEAHSTDYQTRAALRQLVTDHFAILKVGPALTFAYREAIFALARVENELFPAGARSELIEVLEAAMLANPVHWQKYYHGDAAAQALARKYSFSDRARYYWPAAEVQAALARLLENLEQKPLPLALVSQFLPEQYRQIQAGALENRPRALLQDKIALVLGEYAFACGNDSADRRQFART
jgi:D-tagatose-1,6-bisphosphate aldolase subunit GatZ/KbaZ